jgi:hypothetical protein
MRNFLARYFKLHFEGLSGVCCVRHGSLRSQKHEQVKHILHVLEFKTEQNLTKGATVNKSLIVQIFRNFNKISLQSTNQTTNNLIPENLYELL